jgi:hypothetical protein
LTHAVIVLEFLLAPLTRPPSKLQLWATVGANRMAAVLETENFMGSPSTHGKRVGTRVAGGMAPTFGPKLLVPRAGWCSHRPSSMNRYDVPRVQPWDSREKVPRPSDHLENALLTDVPRGRQF